MEQMIVTAYPGQKENAIIEIRSVGGIIQTTYENLIQALLTDDMIIALTRGVRASTTISGIRKPFKPHMYLTSNPTSNPTIKIITILSILFGITWLLNKRR